MEGGALVAEALLAGGKSTEVLSGLGDGLAVETDGDATELFIAVGDVEVDLVLLACSFQSSCHCDQEVQLEQCSQRKALYTTNWQV